MTVDHNRVICRFDELGELDSRAFKLGSGDWPLRGFVVRKNNLVFGYVNRCPHAGHPLNYLPNDFLTSDRTLLLCRSHGACFDIATGVCVAGPCAGANLRPLPLVIEHDHVMLANDPDTLAAEFA